MADYSYEDYRHALISTGEAMMMDLSYNWKRERFNRDYDKQILEDASIKGDKLLAIMLLSDSFLHSNLFIKLANHPSLDSRLVDSMINIGFNGDTHRTQFLLSVLRKREDLITEKVAKTAWRNAGVNPSLTTSCLQSEEACKYINNTDIIEKLRWGIENINFVKKVSNLPHLNNAYMKVFEFYNIDNYLDQSIKDTFLF